MSNITRRRGDTYADEITVRSRETGAPINIAGYTFVMTVDSNSAPTDASTNLYQVTGTILDPASGRVEFAPTAEQADRVGSFFYDVQMVDGLGRKRTIVTGRYQYVQDITKI